MRTMQTQMQIKSKRTVSAKLDEIIRRLDELMTKVEEDIYPDESRFRPSYIKKQQKIEKKLKAGKLKMRTYKDFAEFERAIS